MVSLDFGTAFKYPFNRWKGMLNIFWMFLPILGWFALGGYGVRIVNEFLKGKFRQLPLFEFGNDLSLGFMMFLKALPFGLAYMVVMFAIGKLSLYLQGGLELLIGIFAIPILTINFMKKQTVASFFEFGTVRYVFSNLGDYIVALLKSIALGIIYLVMCLILVGIPASVFAKNIFLADFYRRNVK